MPHSMYTFPAAEQLAGSGLGFLVGLDFSSSVELESGLGFLVGLDFSSSVELESGLGFLVGLDFSSSVELESGLGFLVGLDFSSSVESEGQSEGSTHLFLNLTMPAGQKQPVKEGTHPL